MRSLSWYTERKPVYFGECHGKENPSAAVLLRAGNDRLHLFRRPAAVVARAGQHKPVGVAAVYSDEPAADAARVCLFARFGGEGQPLAVPQGRVFAARGVAGLGRRRGGAGRLLRRLRPFGKRDGYGRAGFGRARVFPVDAIAGRSRGGRLAVVSAGAPAGPEKQGWETARALRDLVCVAFPDLRNPVDYGRVLELLPILSDDSRQHVYARRRENPVPRRASVHPRPYADRYDGRRNACRQRRREDRRLGGRRNPALAAGPGAAPAPRGRIAISKSKTPAAFSQNKGCGGFRLFRFRKQMEHRQAREPQSEHRDGLRGRDRVEKRQDRRRDAHRERHTF